MRKSFISYVASMVLASCGADTSTRSEFKLIVDKNGLPMPDSQVNSSAVAWSILSSQDAEAEVFKSVGSWSGSCSASLIMPPQLDPELAAARNAYALTNGHCISFSGNAVLVDRPTRGSLILNMFKDLARTERVTIPAKLVRYSTMRSTDLAIIELNQTYGELLQQGFRALPLVASQPEADSKVVNIAIPQSGIVAANRFLHRADCSLKERVLIKEGGLSFPAAIRNLCSAVGGSSGSPLLQKNALGQWSVAAVVNTGVSYQSSRPPCSANSPCEVDPKSGKTSSHLYNYAQDVYGLASCFDEGGEFDLSLSSCRVPKP